SIIIPGDFGLLFGFNVSVNCVTSKKSTDSTGSVMDTVAMRLQFKASSGEIDTLVVVGNHCVTSIVRTPMRTRFLSPAFQEYDVLGRTVPSSKEFLTGIKSISH